MKMNTSEILLRMASYHVFVLSADSPEEQVIAGQVPLTVVEHQHPEVTGRTSQLVT